MIIAQLIGLSYGTSVDFSRYVISVVLMYAIGYPIGHTAVLGAFSKIQKSGKHTNQLLPRHPCEYQLSRPCSTLENCSLHEDDGNIVIFFLFFLAFLRCALRSSSYHDGFVRHSGFLVPRPPTYYIRLHGQGCEEQSLQYCSLYAVPLLFRHRDAKAYDKSIH